jgi:hypothetical protein
MTTVVIVPPPGLGSVYGDNRIWAQQYVAASPSDRSMISLAASTPQAVVDATRAAVTAAGTSGRIVYAVGHGGAGHAPEAGQADLAPNQRFRITQFLVYDSDLTGTWPGRPISEMEEGYLSTRPRGRRARPARRPPAAWCERYVEEHCDLAWRQVGELAALRPHYRALCDIFHAEPVSRVIMLTCNVANAPDFLDELSTDLGVRVVAYTERVMSRWLDPSDGPRHVWMYLEGDAEGTGTNIDSSDVELLPGLRSHQVMTGSIRPATPPRATVVPGVGDEEEDD